MTDPERVSDEPIQVSDRQLLRQLVAIEGMPQDPAYLIKLLAEIQMRLNADVQAQREPDDRQP